MEKEQRKCLKCGWEKSGSAAEVMAAFCEHIKQHNPSPDQWGEAYRRIAAFESPRMVRGGEKGR
jgi:hypothetical protein